MAPRATRAIGAMFRPMRRLVCSTFLAVACACAGAPSPGPARGERDRFLGEVETAMAARDGVALARLADWSGWEARAETLALVLPKGPLKRERELSETEVLYKDGAERSWRLLLRQGSSRLLLVPRARPCPAAPMRRRPDAAAPASPASEAPASWTPLECWPLPK